jgi:hypothetical protein
VAAVHGNAGADSLGITCVVLRASEVVVARLTVGEEKRFTIARCLVAHPSNTVPIRRTLWPHAPRTQTGSVHAHFLCRARLLAILWITNPSGALLPFGTQDPDTPLVDAHPLQADFHHPARIHAIFWITGSPRACLPFRTIHFHATSRNASPLKTHFEGPRARLRLAINGITNSPGTPLTLQAVRPDTTLLFALSLDADVLLSEAGMRFAINRTAESIGAALPLWALHSNASAGNTVLFDANFSPTGTIICRAVLRVAFPLHASFVRLTGDVKAIQLNTLLLSADKVFWTMAI